METHNKFILKDSPEYKHAESALSLLNNKFTIGYIFLVNLDDKVCETCQKLDSKFFNISDAKIGLNYPPLHIGCSCYTHPILITDVNKTFKQLNIYRQEKVKPGVYKQFENITYAEWLELKKETKGV